MVSRYEVIDTEPHGERATSMSARIVVVTSRATFVPYVHRYEPLSTAPSWHRTQFHICVAVTSLSWVTTSRLAPCLNLSSTPVLSRNGPGRHGVPPELVDDAIDRIEKLNPELNAVIRPRFDEARREAAGRAARRAVSRCARSSSRT